MRFLSIWLLPLTVTLLQAQEPAGIKITVQSGVAGNHIRTTTTYILADRKRSEYRNSLGEKQGELAYGPRLARIVRCDLGQSFELNLDTSEYTSTPYPPKRLTPEGIKARGPYTLMPPQSANPTIRVETRTADTGERKEIFGHTARHVITTTTQTPLAGSHSDPQESMTDGWYIDFNQQLSCDPKPEGKHGYVLGWLSTGNGKQPMEKPEFATIGERETGFPVDSKMTSKSPTMTDGMSPSVETRVTEFEEEPLDPALFEIPLGFKHVGRIERNLPPSALASKP